jgi:hypothetical protein
MTEIATPAGGAKFRTRRSGTQRLNLPRAETVNTSWHLGPLKVPAPEAAEGGPS